MNKFEPGNDREETRAERATDKIPTSLPHHHSTRIPPKTHAPATQGRRGRGAIHALAYVCAAIALLTASLPATANPLMAPVIAALPDIPLVVNGDLQKRNARGRVEQTYRAEMVLDWKAEIPTARYTIRDAFGAPLQHLAITWDDPAQPSYQYFEGNPLRAAPLPPLNQTIQDTDITWLDLSLSFLWWPGGTASGRESVRGRDCEVVDVPAPAGQVADFDGVRLWLDRKIGIVMRAEGYDQAGTLLRRMDVKSFKKINGRWVIKDIDFTSFPAKTKTTLLVRNVTERDRFELPDRDAPAEDVHDDEEIIDELPPPVAIDS